MTTNTQRRGKKIKAWESAEKEMGAERKTKAFKEFAPGKRGWSAGSPGRPEQNTHTHTYIQYTLHQAVYLLMRLFKNAVGGRALNHPSASLKENWSENHGGGGEGGREGGGEEIFVCEAALAACCFYLASSLHLSLSGGEVGCGGRTL